jgi:hypothetical protein
LAGREVGEEAGLGGVGRGGSNEAVDLADGAVGDDLVEDVGT